MDEVSPLHNAEPAPQGAKTGEALALGALAVSIAPIAATALFDIVASWLQVPLRLEPVVGNLKRCTTAAVTLPSGTTIPADQLVDVAVGATNVDGQISVIACSTSAWAALWPMAPALTV